MKVHMRHRRGKSFYYLSFTKAYVFEKEAKQQGNLEGKKWKKSLKQKDPNSVTWKAMQERKGVWLG